MNLMFKRQLAGASLVFLLVGNAALAQEDDYARMLAYLATDTRIEGNAFAGASGAIAVNQAAGDLNIQANARALANGGQASSAIDLRQRRGGDIANSPLHATATLGGSALANASGIASINQASGSANAELNSVIATLATQGIREASDEAMASPDALASAGEQYVISDPRATRRVGVEATALRGFEGVLQLNQIAGSGNTAENHLGISVQGNP